VVVFCRRRSDLDGCRQPCVCGRESIALRSLERFPSASPRRLGKGEHDRHVAASVPERKSRLQSIVPAPLRTGPDHGRRVPASTVQPDGSVRSRWIPLA